MPLQQNKALFYFPISRANVEDGSISQSMILAIFSLFFLSALSSSEILLRVKGSDQDEKYPDGSRARKGEQTHDLALPCLI